MLTHLHVALLYNGRVVLSKTLWQAKAKIFTVWSLIWTVALPQPGQTPRGLFSGEREKESLDGKTPGMGEEVKFTQGMWRPLDLSFKVTSKTQEAKP